MCILKALGAIALLILAILVIAWAVSVYQLST